MPSHPPAIAVEGLTKAYGKVQALDGLDLQVDPGTVFGLLGPNGAGKSTTVRILTTLSRPDAGRATVAGHDVLTAPDRVRRAIGAVSQKPQFDPVATGRENLVLQGRIHGLRAREARARATALLDRFGLAEAADRQARTWSGGMQRKLDVALGLVHRPQVLFLDEPTTGLDPEARAGMWDEISALAGDEGLTVLLTTHYLDEADRLADALAIVDRGKVVASGTPEELKSELRGDAMQVEVGDAADAARAADLLAYVTGGVTRDGAVLRARVADGATAVPRALVVLQQAGIAVSAVTFSRPSLDDVYLRYAGRSFRTAEQEVAA